METVELEIESARGPIAALYSPPPAGADGPAVAVMVGGADGGFDGPAEAIYPTLAEDLAALGVGALRLDFRIHRFPNDVEEGVHDLVSAIGYLAGEGVERIGLLGHSFGGAVVIEAGVRAAEEHPGAVCCVATLATQSAGAQRVAELAPVPLLLAHGLDDRRLTPDCSRTLHDIAGEPRELVLFPGATHSLRQVRAELRTLLLDWFRARLA